MLNSELWRNCESDMVSGLPLQGRILYWRSKGVTDYHRLMDKCFPADLYPNAFRCSGNGGPPGCAMAFGKALRLLGFQCAARGGAS